MSGSNGNAAVHFIDRHATAAYSGKPAFIEGLSGRTITYAELATETGKLAQLYERHGVRREERVAMLVLDQIEFPIIFWGSLKAGVVPVVLNTLLSTDVYAAILEDSRARALFVSEELLGTVEPLLNSHPYLENVFVVGNNVSAGYIAFSDEFSKSCFRPPIQACSDECAFWLYSSGSTGVPKGVRHVHGSPKVTADTYGAHVLGIRPDDLVFSASKLFFAYGLGNSMSFPLSVGATSILFAGRPTPAAIFDIFNRLKPTVFCTIPTLYAALVAELERGTEKPDVKLRRCLSAAEALPEEVGKRWEKLFGCEILDGVGSTEMLHIFLSNRPGDVEYGTSGMAVPGYEIRLVDEQGGEVEGEEIGELLVKGDSAAADYWNQREKSRTTFEGQWTKTGDKYLKSPEGRLVYCGRTDDMFKVSGIWIAPFEIEQALIAHPSVLEAAVVSARDDGGLEKPKAFVVLKYGASQDGLEARLKDHVKNRIGKWKYPRWIDFVEELPKTATGKIQRFKLRASQS